MKISEVPIGDWFQPHSDEGEFCIRVSKTEFIAIMAPVKRIPINEATDVEVNYYPRITE